MAKLTTSGRKQLPNSAFALPGRRFPVEDRAHARNALARAAANASPAEQKTIKAKVASRFPGIKQGWAHPPHHHSLAMASATHLRGMGHIDGPTHAKIHAKSRVALHKRKAPANPQLPRFGSLQGAGHYSGTLTPVGDDEGGM